MKITQLREKDGNLTLSTTDLDTFLQKIKTETKTQPVSTFRQQLRYCLPGKRCNEADRLPKVLPAAEFRKTNGVCQMKTYNGIVELTVGPLSGKSEIALVKRLAWEQPQTRLVFTGSSGRTVKIWTTFTRPNNSLPGKREEAEVFHAHAYRLAVKCYQPQLPFDILLKEPKLEQYSRLSFDPEAMYRPDSIQFYLAQPVSMPDETTYREALQDEKSPLTRAVPGYEAEEAIIMLFEAALQKTFAEATGAGADNSLHSLTVRLAENCFRSGIPEEETVKRTYFHYYLRQKETVIRQIVRSVYQENKGFNTQSSLSKEQRLAIQTDEFMKRRYEFRYNTVLGDLEYRQRDSIHFYFQPADQRVRSSIAMKALKEGVRVWDRDITRFLSSDYVPLYNPIEEYLYNTGRWDGKDRIRALADLVPCHNPHWRELFYRWFLGMVAHWRGIDKQHGNNTSPLLVGPQGYRKSTFCRILLPPELRFGYTDSVDFKSKQEAERSLGRFFLINIDEFDQINANQQGFLKHLLQKPVANLRKPYGTTIQEMRRYASFIGTSNLKDLLTDPSGSRRFICIEVTGPIQTNVTINYHQLYAQAMHDIMKGERYWLDDTDEAIVKEYNREFERVDPLEELFLCHFRGAEESEEGEWLTAMQIFNDLQQKTRDKLAINRIAAFGRTLRKLDILNKKSNRGTLYHLVRIEE